MSARSRRPSGKDYNKSPEKQLLALAAEIADSKDIQTARLLLKLEGMCLLQ